MTTLAQVTIPYFTGLPEDVAVNTFHFEWRGAGDPVAGDYILLAASINTFYTYVFNASAAIMYLSGVCRPANATMKFYDLDDPEPRAPRYTDTGGITAAADPAFQWPLETACVLSYTGQKASGVDMASRRGRIFLGPLGDPLTGGGDTTHFPQPPPNWVTRILQAAHDLTVNTIDDNWQWVVYSRKLGSSTPIVGGWVDNAWDNQRRRGNKPTARSTWSAFLP